MSLQQYNAQLHCLNTHSDKVYNIDMREVSAGLWSVDVQFGKTGTTLKEQCKTPTPCSFAAASKVVEDLIREKTGKGYNIISSKMPTGLATATPSMKKAGNDLIDQLDRLIGSSVAKKMPVLLDGLPGTGKTFTVREYAKTGGFSGYIEVGGHNGMESYDFLGGMIPIGAGKTVWMDGPVTNAFRAAASKKILLCIDEIGRVPARERGLFLTALTPHDGYYRLRTGRPVDYNEKEGIARMEMILAPVANLSIVATTNSGSNFADVELDDDAGKERWHIIHLKPDPVRQRAILESKLEERGWPVSLAKHFIDLQQNIRKVKEDNFCAKELTPRLTFRVLDLATGPSPQEIAAAARELIPALTGRTPEGEIIPEHQEMLDKAIDRITAKI